VIDERVVFVVEDDPSVRKAIGRLLKSIDLPVELFSSAQEFLQRVPPECPSCLVLDVRLPGLSGLDLQEELARTGRDLPIVFITGHATVPMGVKAIKGGATDFLEKPFDDEQLLTAIGVALDKDLEAKSRRNTLQELQNRMDGLTGREREVFRLVTTGLLNKRVAAKLGTSEKTIKVHRGRVMRKMRAVSFAHLVLMAQELGVTVRPAKAEEATGGG